MNPLGETVCNLTGCRWMIAACLRDSGLESALFPAIRWAKSHSACGAGGGADSGFEVAACIRYIPRRDGRERWIVVSQIPPPRGTKYLGHPDAGESQSSRLWPRAIVPSHSGRTGAAEPRVHETRGLRIVSPSVGREAHATADREVGATPCFFLVPHRRSRPTGDETGAKPVVDCSCASGTEVVRSLGGTHYPCVLRL